MIIKSLILFLFFQHFFSKMICSKWLLLHLRCTLHDRKIETPIRTSFVFGIPDPLILMLFEQSLCLNTYVKHESGQEKKILT